MTAIDAIGRKQGVERLGVMGRPRWNENVKSSGHSDIYLGRDATEANAQHTGREGDHFDHPGVLFKCGF